MINTAGRYGRFRRFISPLFFFLLCLAPLFLSSRTHGEESLYIESLLGSARQKQLHQDPYWRALLHYKKGLSGMRSLVDDPKFFLSPQGKRHPDAELEATIRALFSEREDDTEHPACRFIARYTWLKKQLNIDTTRLPVPACARFESILNQMKPESAMLIFPTSHMNMPASMFGHTLLTIETVSGSKLLSHAINYSAVTPETFGFLYAIKGLFGFYEGYFSMLPYYAKIQEYSDVAHRDIWEYPLNLNPEEIERLLMHLYELDSIYSDYYFFDENCSYVLLFLLDAARPSLNLTDQCRWWVIPLDTIKLAKQNGLIEGAVYRPSKTTKIEHLASLLPKKGQEMALSIANGKIQPESLFDANIPDEEKTTVCDLATEYLQYQYTAKELTKEPYVDRFLRTLRVRSLLGEPDKERAPIPVPGRPDEGHHSNRFSLGVGIQEDEPFQEMRYRPAYHTLLDFDKGYKEGSQIVFCDTSLRYYDSSRKLELQYLDVIDIVSITPVDAFFQPVSWKIRTGLKRTLMEDEKDHLVGELNPGFGFSVRSRFLGLCYLMAEADFNLGGALDDNYALGIGASTGFIKAVSAFWKIHFFVKDVYYGLGDRHNTFEAGLSQNFPITANTSLSAEMSFCHAHDADRTDGGLYWNFFF